MGLKLRLRNEDKVEAFYIFLWTRRALAYVVNS